MANCITLISDPVNNPPLVPPFKVDFSQYSEEKSVNIPVESKIESVFEGIVRNLKEIFISIFEAGKTTLADSKESFRRYVLCNTALSQLPFIPFRAILWIVLTSISFFLTAVRLYYQDKQNLQEEFSLSSFAGDEIDISHITTADVSIDVSEVPKEVTVNDLLVMFEEVNFNNEEDDGYVPPSWRKEGSYEHSVEELRTNLTTFVNHVNGRVAFIGTPPEYDRSLLLAFYQQIEDATRFAIHRSNQALSAFKNEYGEDREGYTTEVLNKYKNILEDRARIPVNLAIAGARCGARYMGEAMELYETAQGKDSVTGKTLKDILINLLAKKRKDIAHEHIATYLGDNAHSYSNYMSTFGKVLGIPGTKNIIEHLSMQLNYVDYLTRFFQEYTVDCIITTVREEVKKSNELRTILTDWLRDQKGDWRPKKDDEKILAKAREVLNIEDLDTTQAAYKSLKDLVELVDYLNERQITVVGDESTFVESLLYECKGVTLWLKHKYNDTRSQMEAKMSLKRLFDHDQLGDQDLRIKTRQAIEARTSLDIEQFKSKLIQIDKVNKLCKVAHLVPATAMRVLQGVIELDQAVIDRQKQLSSAIFLEYFDIEQWEEIDLSKELLEWVLVSQKILLNQEVQ